MATIKLYVAIMEDGNMRNSYKTLEDKLNFINDAKKTNIARINVESIDVGRIRTNPLIFKKHYIFEVH